MAALGAALAALFAASLLLTGAGGSRVTGNPVGPNTYSRSAVGHLGLFDVLQKLGYRVVRGERDILALLGTNGILVLAEPTSAVSGGSGNNNLLGAQTILVVLPKWSVRRSEQRNDWIEEVQLAPEYVAQSVFYAVAGPGNIARVTGPSGFQNSLAIPDPTVSGPMQLIKNSKLKPIVATAEGILLRRSVARLQVGPRESQDDSSP